MHNGGAKIAMGRHVERAAIIVKIMAQCKVRGKTRFEPRSTGSYLGTVTSIARIKFTRGLKTRPWAHAELHHASTTGLVAWEGAS